MGSESAFRLAVFCSIFATVALWELLAPRRTEPMLRRQRWFANLLLVGIDILLMRLLLPVGAVGVAIIAQQQQWGLLYWLEQEGWPATLLAIILLDGIIYWQHRLFHRIPLLWRLHRVHHADIHLDVTSGLRFHPLEIVLSMLIKIGAIILLGADPLTIILFEAILNGMALFNHGNIRLPEWLDRILRWLWVTPDMHRIHHSTDPHEFNRNFGFNFSCWDRLFASYQAQPQAGQLGMTIGLSNWRDSRTASLIWMLRMPWLPLTDSAPTKSGAGNA